MSAEPEYVFASLDKYSPVAVAQLPLLATFYEE